MITAPEDRGRMTTAENVPDARSTREAWWPVGRRRCALVSLVFLVAGGPLSFGALPDLIIYAPVAKPRVVYRVFGSNDCEVLAGCAQPGLRQLLIFTTSTRNIGEGEVVFGDPATNVLYSWSPCERQYQMENYAAYRLRDSTGAVVAAANKAGYCLADDFRWSTNANPDRRFTCGYQGIQPGWADVYSGGNPCNWLDVTGLVPGNYELELEIDPANLIAESNETNNITRFDVVIPEPCGPPPPNDNFADAEVISGTPASVTGSNLCATKESGEPEHGGDLGGYSVWYRWTAGADGPVVLDTIGSDFDTLLAVYTGGSMSELTLVAQNEDITPALIQSRVSFNAIAGVSYQIAVDGFLGATGHINLRWVSPGRLAIVQTNSVSIELVFTAEPGRYEIQSSTNLQQWSVLATVELTNSPVRYMDGGVDQVRQRFYRALVLP